MAPVQRRACLGLLALLGLAAILPAQRTWVVDERNGPGTDFVDLDPAVSAATDGDTILIRPGHYYGTSITAKGLRLTATAPGVLIGTISILNLAAAQRLVLSGVRILLPPRCVNVLGALHLQDAAFGPKPMFVAPQRHVFANCRRVTADNCELFPVLCMRGSTALFTRCTFLATEDSYPALEIIDSNVMIADSDLTGGDEVCGPPRQPLSPGVSMNGGSMIATGATVIRGGVAQCGGNAAAITSSGGTVRLGLAVRLLPTGTSPPITGNSTIDVTATPAVLSAGIDTSNRLLLDTVATPGELTVLLASEATPDAWTPFGMLWVAPAHLVLDAGAIGATGRRRFALPLGGLPSDILGAFQAVTLGAGPLTLSTPTIVPL